MVRCPVCGSKIDPDVMEITCEKCGWDIDVYQEEYPDETGINPISLNEAKRLYSEGKYMWDSFEKRKPDDADELKKRFKELGIL